MAGLDDILKSLPIDRIASQLGVDPAVAKQAIEEGGGAILSGLQKNAQTPEGSAAIEKALGKHSGLGDSIDLDAVDTADGEKILAHVFGGQEKQVAQKLTEEPKTAGIDFGKLLPILAPIVLGLLAKNQQKGPATQQQQGSGGGIGDLIGGLLGGGASGGAQAPSAGGIDIGGLLGGLLGGTKQ
ncbi:MAG: DUF937 domain-containing protein [Microbacterium sp.]